MNKSIKLKIRIQIMKKLILPISILLLFAVGCDNPMLDNRVELDNSELPSYIIENYEKYKKWFDY